MGRFDYFLGMVKVICDFDFDWDRQGDPVQEEETPKVGGSGVWPDCLIPLNNPYRTSAKLFSWFDIFRLCVGGAIYGLFAFGRRPTQAIAEQRPRPGK